MVSDDELPREQMLVDVASAPSGLLISVGGAMYQDPTRAAVYTSPDGLAWTPAPDQPTLAGAAMRGIDCDRASCSSKTTFTPRASRS